MVPTLAKPWSALPQNNCLEIPHCNHFYLLLTMIEENRTAESGPDFMLCQLHCNVVLASRRLVLFCLILEWKHLAQLGQCRPKELIDLSKNMLQGVVRERFIWPLSEGVRAPPPLAVVNQRRVKRRANSGFVHLGAQHTASSSTLCMWQRKVL